MMYCFLKVLDTLTTRCILEQLICFVFMHAGHICLQGHLLCISIGECEKVLSYIGGASKSGNSSDLKQIAKETNLVGFV